MTKRVRILGKMIPVWLMVIALVASGAGAAAGTVLAGPPQLEWMLATVCSTLKSVHYHARTRVRSKRCTVRARTGSKAVSSRRGTVPSGNW